jgi:hypothetical protein
MLRNNSVFVVPLLCTLVAGSGGCSEKGLSPADSMPVSDRGLLSSDVADLGDRGHTGDGGAPGKISRIVFSGTFGTTANCYKFDMTGCDLFVAEYDLAHQRVVSVTKLAGKEGLEESFPAQDPKGRFFLYDQRKGNTHNIYSTAIDGTPTKLLPNAKQVYISSDGSLVGYTEDLGGSKFNVVIRPISFLNGTIVLGDEEFISSDQESKEPIIFPGNNTVAYYRQGAEPLTGQTLLFDRTTKALFEFSPTNGCSHGTVSYDGLTFFCDVTSDPKGRTFDGSSWSAYKPFPLSDAEKPDYFSDCDSVSYGHTEYCGDNDHLLTTLGCIKNGQSVAAKLAIITNTGKVVAHFNQQIESFMGAGDSQSRGGVCTWAE